jgi:hypothetical protein
LFELAEKSLPVSAVLAVLFFSELITGLTFSDPPSPHSILSEERRRGRGGVLEGEDERDGSTKDLTSWNFGSKASGGRGKVLESCQGTLITYPNRGFKGSVFDVKIDPDLVARVQRAHAFLNMGEASTERLMVRGCDRQFVFTF